MSELAGRLQLGRLTGFLLLGIGLLGLTLLAWHARGRTPQLRSIDMPDLSGLSEADREQLERLQADLQAHSVENPLAFGRAQGELGRHYLAFDFFEPASAALGNAAMLDRRDHRWPYLLGYIDQTQGRFESALTHYRAAAELEPDKVPLLVRLAESLRGLGDDRAAEEPLERVLELEPQHATAHYLLGLIALEREAYQQAVDHLEAALKIQPQAGVLRNPLAQAYRGLGDLEAVELVLRGRRSGRVTLHDPELQAVLDLRRSANARMSEGSRVFADGRFDEAIELYREATQLEPDNPATHLGLGGVLVQLGRYEEAVESLQRALALEPSNANANRELGVALLLDGRSKDAIEPLRHALDADSTDVKARLALSEALFADRRCDQALPVLQDRLEDAAEDSTSRLRLGVCLVALGRHEEALRAIEDGLALDPEQPLLQAALVRLLAASPEAELRDGERALRVADALRATGDGVDAREVRAMALAELGRFEEALEMIRTALEAIEDEGPAERVDWLRQLSESYAEGRALRQPWPPDLIDR